MNLFIELRKHGKLAAKRNPMYEKNKFGKFWMYFMAVFWAGYLVFFGTSFAFAFNDGNFKWYEAPLMLGGFAVYRLTLSRIVIFCIFAVIDFVKKMLRKLVTPLVRLTLKSIKKIQKTVECFRQKRAVLRLKKCISHCYFLVRPKN